jgi:hypothetical protein
VSSNFKHLLPPSTNTTRHQVPPCHQAPTPDTEKLHWFDKNDNWLEKIAEEDTFNADIINDDYLNEDSLEDTAASSNNNNSNNNKDRVHQSKNSKSNNVMNDTSGWYNKKTPITTYLRQFHAKLKEQLENKRGDLYEKLVEGEIEFKPPAPTTCMINAVKKGSCPSPDPYYWPSVFVSIKYRG